VQGQKSGIQRKADGADDKAEVSQPGEPAEQEADAKADAVAGDLHDGGDEKKDEKKKGAKGEKGEKEGEGGDAKAGEKGDTKEAAAPISAKLEGVGRKIFRTATPTAVVPGGAVELGGESQAKNPKFEADAIEFEKNLGGVAFGKAQAIGAQIMDKVRSYIASKVGTEDLDKLGEETQKLLKACASGASFAGSVKPEEIQDLLVGKTQLEALHAEIAAAKGDAEKLKSLPEPPNLREQMTLIYNFGTKIMIPDILKTPKDKLEELCNQSKMNLPAVERRVAFMEEKAKGGAKDGRNLSGMVPGQAGDTPKSEEDKKKEEDKKGGIVGGEGGAAVKNPQAVEGQRTARVNRNDAESEKGKADAKSGGKDEAGQAAAGDAAKSSPASDRSANDLEAQGAGLSSREKAMQGGGDADPLKWAEGSKVWVANENDKWTKAVRELSLPIAAGPSGTTNVLMNINAMLGGADPQAARLACVGYLLPINAHSLVEICGSAAGHGVPFTAGQGIYKDLPPLAEPELRACGRDGGPGGKKLFPDEAAPVDEKKGGEAKGAEPPPAQPTVT
jgi:hypothetical protein